MYGGAYPTPTSTAGATPGYPPTSGYPATSTAGYPVTANNNASVQQQAASPSAGRQDSVPDDMMKASLLSAVEEKMKRRLDFNLE